MWAPIADELGIPWQKAEALHWLIGRKQMRREANAITFAIAAADAEPRELRQVVQRDGTLKSTEVFEGRDLTPIRSPSVSGCPDGHGPGTPGHPASTPVNITLIDSEPSYDDQGEEEDSEGEEEDDSEGEEEDDSEGEEEDDDEGEEEDDDEGEEEDDDEGEEDEDDKGEEEDDNEGEEEEDDKGEEEDDNKGEEEDDNKGEEERGPRIWRETNVDGNSRLPGITEFIAGGYGSRREGRETRWTVGRRRHTVHTKASRKIGNRQAP